MSENKLSSYQEEAFSRVFRDWRADYIAWYDEEETSDLPDDHLPIGELLCLLESIQYEMMDEDREWAEEMGTIHIDEFKALMASKVDGPDETIGPISKCDDLEGGSCNGDDSDNVPGELYDDSQWLTHPLCSWEDPQVADWGFALGAVEV
ncbi:uncharacterized protein EI90DRAFT_3038280 [Cantharellus anzutake]|uniref:uncharacterized protein n=1 Tax=Cantharellus anzutake TaxID=1750568 RepID=UPI0019073A5C|nr:uncharacterized protein EI90DRAFT_3038280 [Cantharellus anzutake]KAF8339906.1 hypothetical protein EI90DRAFT_3038280 [Cantharellus anzutake]